MKKIERPSSTDQRLIELWATVRWAEKENQTDRSGEALYEVERALVSLLKQLELWKRSQGLTMTEPDGERLVRKLDARSARRRGVVTETELKSEEAKERRARRREWSDVTP